MAKSRSRTTRNHDIYDSGDKKFGRQSDTERKVETTKKNSCYICDGRYAKCPEESCCDIMGMEGERCTKIRSKE